MGVLRHPPGEPVSGRPPSSDTSPPPHLIKFRAAVDDLLTEVVGSAGPSGVQRAEAVLGRRLDDAEFRTVLTQTPEGMSSVVESLTREVRDYRPNDRSAAIDLTALIRIFLLSQIDAVWWGRTKAYALDADMLRADELVELEPLRRRGALKIRYRTQSEQLWTRGVRAAMRRLAPDRTPRTVGLRYARTRPEVIALAHSLATDFTRLAPAGTPELWVNSLTRSVDYQLHLRSLGYSAVLPSAHCVGYAVDIEMAWFARFGARPVLEELLLERRDSGAVNVIDEGQAWHVCINPAATADLRRAFDREFSA